MKATRFLLVAVCLLLASCKNESSTSTSTTSTGTSSPGVAGSTTPPSGTMGSPPGGAAAQIENGAVELSPANTRIRFVGTHADPAKPEPRTGQFGEFTGELRIDNDQLKAVNVELQVDSITTDAGDRLTSHLKTPDFFDAREYPTANFKSKSVEAGNNGEFTVTGDLTMHGVTKEITFPATMKVEDGKVTLDSNFTINRSEFGMNFSPDRVLNDVNIMVAVGTPTSAFETAGGPSGGQRGGFNPAQIFENGDADKDGKLSGDEIPGFFKPRLSEFDTDGDGSISKEEFQQQLSRGFPGGPGGGPGGAPGTNPPGAGPVNPEPAAPDTGDGTDATGVVPTGTPN